MKHENRVPASTGASTRSGTVQIVLNPRAGRGRAVTLIEPLLEGLRKRGYHPSVLVTKNGTDARSWAQACERPPEYLISLAGDDTLDDLAEAAIRHQIPIISTPLGYGNVCPQAFGHRADVAAILDLLETGRRIDVDVGLWRSGSGGTRYFLAVTIYGFMETIKAMAETGIDRGGDLRRMIGYLLATARWLSLGQALPSVTIEVDGVTISERAALVVVANLPVFPGRLVFSRDADPHDGLLDICLVSGDTKGAVLAALCALAVGGPFRDHRILRCRGRVVRVLPPAVEAHPHALDGGLETLTVLPRALPVLVPSDGAR